ncbi:MAG: hypothetical protein OEM52_03620 [bacterium]|nr:hypothetical protein [bacterium]
MVFTFGTPFALLTSMIEMLANQRFLANRFDEALPLYNELVDAGRITTSIRRRQLVCEIVAGDLVTAASRALALLHDNPNGLLQFEPGDDCPCEWLIQYLTESDLSFSGRFRVALLSLYGCGVSARKQFDELYRTADRELSSLAFQLLHELEEKLPCESGTVS